MESTLASIRKRLSCPWVVDLSHNSAIAHFDEMLGLIGDDSETVILAENDDKRFLFGLLAAVAKGNPLVLAKADWPKTLWSDVPDLGLATVLGSTMKPQCGLGEDNPDAGSILIATGGSGGKLRFVVHTWASLVAAVQGYQQFFQRDAINCVSLLPLHHVGGLMPCLRTFVSGGRLILGSWKVIESGLFPNLPSNDFHISLVPTQLSRLLKTAGGIDWLCGFEAVLIGGGPSSQALLNNAHDAGIRVHVAYGMTETAGTIALQRPQSFVRGQVIQGELLPHLNLRINDSEILLSGKSLSSTYWGSSEEPAEWFFTGDEGSLSADGRLTVSGRKGRWINTGGEKVDPNLVEQALLATGFCSQAVVFGLPDPDWGESVSAILVGKSADEGPMLQLLRNKLPAFMIPKKVVWTEEIPRTSIGKPNLQAIREMVSG
ncbi:AMP-binding protein [Rubellicoccus peritrichatus]|uniref:AMP-binding protein n=1 Tax=Rubellicoccus peritrichatus TaxID=3080537 RepID=A0AAQ3QS89_9BACT|nr:AMP-binding protein [Puniceicoccus sp. CR14]WOO42158.1 AMP-binding protein [Puniceicoccus sp. CR14]